MRTLLTTTLCLLALSLSAQSQRKLIKARDAVMKEGLALYRTEKAAWFGTDVFLAEFSDTDRIGGYVTYDSDAGPRCVFYDQAQPPVVLGTVRFSSDFDHDRTELDLSGRPLTEQELTLGQMRRAASEALSGNPIVKTLKNTRFNLVPIIFDGQRKVYVLSGPAVTNMVVLGNDYLVLLDKKMRVEETKALHANPLIFPYAGEDGKEIATTVHSHTETTGSYITPTDICTLLLYAPFTSWKQHTVISKQVVSIFDMEKSSLVFLKRSAYDKMFGGR